MTNEWGDGSALQAACSRTAPEGAFPVTLVKVGEPVEAADRTTRPQLMVCREWPLERVVAQAAWQFQLWPRRLLEASPSSANARTLKYTTVKLSTLRPFVHPSFLEAESGTGGETEVAKDHPTPPRDECIGADEEVAITCDAQWRRLIGSHPWTVDATRAHTLLYIQVRCCAFPCAPRRLSTNCLTSRCSLRLRPGFVPYGRAERSPQSRRRSPFGAELDGARRDLCLQELFGLRENTDACSIATRSLWELAMQRQHHADLPTSLIVELMTALEKNTAARLEDLWDTPHADHASSPLLEVRLLR